MTEVPPPSAPEPQTAPAADASHAVHEPHPRLLYALLALLLAALAFGSWGLWKTFAAEPGASQSQLREQQARIDDLEQRVATLTRSDQISREANRDLQGTLAERDEEIAGLRADVAFYERFVGATGQRRGLTVHQLHLQPQGDQAWHFTATLTQNINRGAVSRGRLTLSVEGTRDGALQRLSWADLRQQPDAPGTEYSFKYFQEVEGDLLLPPGFKPLRVQARLVPASGAAVEQSFTWADAVARPAAGA
jgi:cell division protein FtsB